MIRALYPGTFDPIHNGHIDIAARAAALFDELIIGVYDTPPKTLLLDTSQRILLCRECLGHLPNVEVRAYTGLTVDFAHAVDASLIVRGLRAISDFEYEFQMALTNKTLAPDVEFVCLMTSLEYAYLSSTILKEIAYLGGDITAMTPEVVRRALELRFAEVGPPPKVPTLASSRD
jgi:pantetheine-phosphate adenylyltransferase